MSYEREAFHMADVAVLVILAVVGSRMRFLRLKKYFSVTVILVIRSASETRYFPII